MNHAYSPSGPNADLEQTDERYTRWLQQQFTPGKNALSSAAPYVRWLRGEYGEFEKHNSALVHGENEEADGVGEPVLTVLEKEYLAFRSRVKDQEQEWQAQFILDGDPNYAKEKDPATVGAQVMSGCDRCQRDIAADQRSFYCDKCGGGDYDLCEDCFDEGFWCEDVDHELRLVKYRVAMFNQPVRVFARTPVKKLQNNDSNGFRLPPDLLNLQVANLGAVIDNYMAHVQGQPHSEAKLLALPKTDSNTKADMKDVTWSTWAVHRWLRICVLLSRDEFTPSFRSILSPVHFEVVKLLLEWWLGEIQDYRLSMLGISGLLVQTLHQGTTPDVVDTITGTNRSLYHRAMIQLFVLELGDRERAYSALQAQRTIASRQACAQRFAYSCLRGTLAPLWHDPTQNIHETATQHLQRMAIAIAAPMTVCREKDNPEAGRFCAGIFYTCFVAMGLAVSNMRTCEQLLGPKELKASIEPCHWLSGSVMQQQMPYYLWDTKRRCTIKTQNFTYIPHYTVISHTWGRWKTAEPAVTINGVPWPVPQNSRFVVNNIADILAQVPGNNRYIWFDLVCIPQTPEDPDLCIIERGEIAKQAGIFSLAERAIAWFSDIKSFGTIGIVCEALAINAMKYPGPFDFDQVDSYIARVIDRLNIVEHSPLPLLRSTPKKVAARWHEALHEWFTSLWTLQEACIRPDMWLCSQNFEVITTPASKNPLTLDCLLSLARINIPKAGILDLDPTSKPKAAYATKESNFRNLVYQDAEAKPSENFLHSAPRIVSDFMASVSASGITDIPGISRIRILVLGNQRFCEQRRAQAIMAVLGATEWFDTSSSSISGEQDDLVLGKYPLSFIQEVRQKLGDHEFFVAVTVKDFWSIRNTEQSFESQVTELDMRGTLLPFSATESYGAVRAEIDEYPDTKAVVDCHPSLKAWRVLTNGNVEIPRACILFSSPSTSTSISNRDPTNVSIIENVSIGDLHRVVEAGWKAVFAGGNLHEWIETRDYNCYVIFVSRTTRFDSVKPLCSFRGLILRGLEGRPGTLVRVGWWKTRWLDQADYGWEEEKHVNWTVL